MGNGHSRSPPSPLTVTHRPPLISMLHGPHPIIFDVDYLRDPCLRDLLWVRVLIEVIGRIDFADFLL